MTFEETFPVGSQLFIPVDQPNPEGWEEVKTVYVPATALGEETGVVLGFTIIERAQ